MLILMSASAVLVYMGASLLLFFVVADFGHGAELSTIVQVAVGVGGVALLAVGAGAVLGVRHLQRR